MKFTEFNFHPDIQKGIDSAGFSEATPVQEQTFKHTLAAKDILAQSQTGTGKTAAFLLSIFQLFMTDKIKRKKALILVPTRELAVQIEEEAKLLGKYLPYKIGSFYGGVGYAKQEMLLQDGVDFCIATPGRLIDFLKSKKLSLSEFGAAIVDEADRMFDMGFIPDIRFILKKMPPAGERITMLFSATLSSKVRSLAWEYMSSPAEIEISPESVTVDAIEQTLYHVGGDEKMKMLLGILKNDKPESAIIFSNTKNKVEEISFRLKNNGFENEYIIGDLPQKKRQRIIDGIKEGKIKFLVATDVAARGLHVDDLDIVINYDLPDDCENYVHRIGRTARAGKKGRAVAFACEKFVYNLPAIENYLGRKIPVGVIDDAMLAEDSSKDIRMPRDDKRHHMQKNQSHDRRQDKFAKKTNATHSSYDKPVHKKHTVFDKDSENKKQFPSQDNFQNRNKPKPQFKGKPKGSVEQRVEYYRKKYGENFKVSEEMIKSEKKKKSIIGKILGIFGINK